MENGVTTNVEDVKFIVERSTKQNFDSIGSWAKLLGICGYIMVGILVSFGLVFLFLGPKMFSAISAYQSASMDAAFPGMFFQVFLGLLFIVYAVIYFFPAHFCYRAGKGFSDAVRHGDQASFDYASGKLKNLFIFYGVLAVIGLVLAALYLIVLFVIAGFALSA